MASLLGTWADSFFGGRKGPRIDRRRSLALKPVRNPKVSWSPAASAEDVTIEIPLRRRPVPKPLIWLATKLARRQPPDNRRLQLDAIGSYVWRCADGKHTVRELIWLLAAEYKLNRRDAEAALIDFLGKLSTRNILGFANIPDSPPQT
jgi:hypothetical protein